MARVSALSRRGDLMDLMEWMDWMPPEGWLRPWRGATLRIEEFQDGDDQVIRAQIPGVDPEKDINVSLHEGMLTIEASRTQSSKVESATGYRSEFTYGSFLRTIPVSSDVDPDDVKATYESGVLEVRLKRTGKPSESHRITVTHNGG